MFGELEDSDIYVNNQNESFEETAEHESFQDEEPVVYQEPPKAQDNKKLLIYILILVLLLVTAGSFYFYKMKSSQDENAIVPPDQQQMGDYFYDQTKGADQQTTANTTAAGDTAVVDVDLTAAASQDSATADVPAPTQPKTEAQKKAESPVTAAKEQAKKELAKDPKSALAINKHVVVSVSNGGRINPFVPAHTGIASSKAPAFDLIAPPIDIPEEDPLNDELMATKISGIMYDSQRPSAIINFDGTDHLVHKGDRVKGYSVIDITKDRVVMKYGTNIYRAAVGQQIDESVKFNEVSNLNRQFGGAYQKTPSNIIEIKGSN